MEAQSRKGLLFCPLTGELLTIDAATNTARSTQSSFSVSLDAIANREVVTQDVDMADYSRRFGLEMLVKPRAEAKADKDAINARTLATIDEPCPQCGNPEMEYYTLQLRSADEGQTVFYECPSCGYKYSTNN